MSTQPFAVFDIDGTLIRWQLYHSIVEELAKQGHIDQQEYQRIKTSRMTWKNRQHENTFSEYQSTLVEVFHDSLKQLPTDKFDIAIQNVFETYKDQVYTYTRDLIQDLKNQGYLLFAISGSHHEIVQLLAKYYGFDEAVGNSYDRKDGVFTGAHQFVVERKPELLHELIDKHQTTLENSIAVGDSGSDINMLELVQKPIAFNPDITLFKYAKTSGWSIVLERKNVIYKLERGDDRYILA